MRIILPTNRLSYELRHKVNRVDCLVYYELRVPFVHIETIKNRYEEPGPVYISDWMKANLITEIHKLKVDTLRVFLMLQEHPVGTLPYDKIFKYEHILMLQSGLVEQLEIFPEIL